jgi:ATP-binding cassette subfamily B protein
MLGREFTNGVEPSGGQWQKQALARALYRESKVLILDEPTAAVDAESESRILRRLSRSDDRTVILIAHRFSVLRSTDRICVMEGGSVQEVGTHEELLDSPGTYARLFNLQAAAYQ